MSASGPFNRRLKMPAGLGIIGMLTSAAPALGVAAPNIVWQVQGHTSGVPTVAYSPDGQSVASGGDLGDETAQVRDAAGGTLLDVFPGQAGGVRSVAFSPDGSQLAIGGIVPGDIYPASSGSVDVWDVAPAILRYTFPGGYAAFASETSSLASGGLGLSRHVAVHQLSDGGELADVNTGDYIVSLAFSPNGQTVASGDYDGEIYLWDIPTGSLRETLYHGDRPNALAFSPDGAVLASGNIAFDANSSIKFWRVSDGQLLRTLSGYDAYVSSVAFSADGRYLISSGSDASFARRIRFWRASDGTPLATLDPGPTAVLSAVFSPDGTRFAYGRSDGTVAVAQTPFTPFGDADGDGDVDLDDYTVFADCLADADAPPSPTTVTVPQCLDAFDGDGDNDVDLADFAGFQVALIES